MSVQCQWREMHYGGTVDPLCIYPKGMCTYVHKLISNGVVIVALRLFAASKRRNTLRLEVGCSIVCVYMSVHPDM